jgi:chromate reductase
MTKRLSAMCGSFRSGSYNQALLDEAIARGRKHGLEIEQVAIGGFPFYSQDMQAAEGDSEPVQHAKQVVAASECLLLATPEYDFGVPGVLKNAIEWLSRPFGDPTLVHKPLALIGASTGVRGTIRAQLAWRQTWVYFKAPVFSEVELTVALARDVFDAEDRIADGSTEKRLEEYLAALSAWLDG